MLNLKQQQSKISFVRDSGWICRGADFHQTSREHLQPSASNLTIIFESVPRYRHTDKQYSTHQMSNAGSQMLGGGKDTLLADTENK